jgi:hypothetical protein
VDIRTYKDSTTWNALHNVTRQLYPNACIEPGNKVNYDHLHVDWRPWSQCYPDWRK